MSDTRVVKYASRFLWETILRSCIELKKTKNVMFKSFMTNEENSIFTLCKRLRVCVEKNCSCPTRPFSINELVRGLTRNPIGNLSRTDWSSATHVKFCTTEMGLNWGVRIWIPILNRKSMCYNCTCETECHLSFTYHCHSWPKRFFGCLH